MHDKGGCLSVIDGLQAVGFRIDLKVTLVVHLTSTASPSGRR